MELRVGAAEQAARQEVTRCAHRVGDLAAQFPILKCGPADPVLRSQPVPGQSAKHWEMAV